MNEVIFAIRRLRKHPQQLAAGILAFMLGIGLNTAMYSIADVILFRPLELKSLDRLAVFDSSAKGVQMGIRDMSLADFLEFQSNLKSFESLGFTEYWNATITRDADPEVISASRVSSNWFDMLGSTILLGRGFRPGEDQAGKNRVAVLSHGLWSRRYASDPKVIGRQIRLNSEDYEIVGVVKQTSRFPSYVELFSPFPRTPAYDQNRTDFEHSIVGRLKPGVSLSSANAELSLAQASIIKRYKESHEGRSVQLVPLSHRVAGTNDMARQYTGLLLIAAGFALMIACANVANLQLARVTGRTREFAIMTALGSGRWPIARQVLVESLILSGGGAIIGCIASVWCLDLFKALLPPDVWQFIPMWPYMQVDASTLTTTALLALAAGVFASVAPAWQSSLSDAQDSLREGGRGASASLFRQYFRGALVAFQMALAIILLIGAGLMVRSAQASLQAFDSKHPEQIATMQAILPQAGYPNQAKRIDFARRLDSELKRLPGASKVALVNHLPLSDDGSSLFYSVEGRPLPNLSERPRALNQVVTPSYFELMKIPLRQGRYLSEEDREGRDPVCVIDELLAKARFPQSNPVGERLVLLFGDTKPTCRIVGVVGSEIHWAWEKAPRPTIYRAFDQNGSRSVALMVFTTGSVSNMLSAAKKAVLAVDADQPVRQQYAYDELIRTTLAGLRMIAIFMSCIGLVALALSCLGVYSVISYVVAERTSEIGMRLAMGAQPIDIFRLLGRQAFFMTASGILVGLICGYFMAQLFSGLIFGISSSDFWSLSSGTLVLVAVAALAIYFPARRAIHMDPATALRHD
jgi:putative ABC transport system permease protein